MNPSEKVLLGTAPIVNANRYKDLLAAKEIAIELAYNTSTCKTGCSHTMEIWAHPDDVAAVVALIKEDNSRNFAGLEFDSQLLEQVFDPEKSEAQCPACGCVFATTASECPDCGLGFSAGGPA
jgi:hypothetical protein